MSIVTDTTRRSAARTAAAGYVALFVLAIFANFVVKQGVIHPGDAAATVGAIQDQEFLFRIGIAAFATIVLLDIVVAWALYVLFIPAGRYRSLLPAWFRLIYSALLAVGIVFMSIGLEMAIRDSGTSGEATLVILGGFDIAWLLGLLAFGIHLVLLGALIVRTHLAPRFIGAVLIVAGAAYILDTLLHMLMSDYSALGGIMLGIVAVTSIVAELAFTIWLIREATRAGVTQPVPA